MFFFFHNSDLENLWLTYTKQELKKDIQGRMSPQLTLYLDFDFLYFKAKNDGPHQTQDEPWIAVYDVLWSNALETNLESFQKSDEIHLPL